MEQLVDIPAQITPWLVLFSTTIGALGSLFWARRRVAQAFVDAVNNAMTPLQETVERIEQEQIVVSDRLVRTSRDRKREIDAQFAEVRSQVRMLEARITKAQESA